jgi:catechol 2,3-dioxygenase-like lactoylglutathione lyase family enzyme
MKITPQTNGIHHIALRCVNMSVTRNFYQEIIGFPLVMDTAELIIFKAGNVFVAFKQAYPRSKENASFSPLEVGLDHIALACDSEEELHRFANGLLEAGVENTGVKLDETLGKLYVAFKDPDRIQWEFYMM